MKIRTILFSLALAGIAAFVTSCSPSSLTGDETSQQSLEIPNNVILYKSTTGTIVIPYDVNAFGANIVSNTYSEDGVGRIVFDADLKEIGYGAFMNCDELVSITLPNSITTMGQGETFHFNGISFTLCGAVFAGCEHLTSVHLPTALSYLPGGTFSNCLRLSDIQLPKGVTIIGEEAFYGCRELKTITIPNAVTYIGDYAFSESGIRSIKLPNSLVYLGRDVFENANDLAPFSLPNSVTHILGCNYNDDWTSITLPESITHIGRNSFDYMEDTSILHDWSSITIKSKVPPIICDWHCFSSEWGKKGKAAIEYHDNSSGEDETLFSGSDQYPSGCTIYVPAASVQAYKEALGWRHYADIIKAIP